MVDDNTKELIKNIKELRANGKDWERFPIAIAGNVSVVKMPTKKGYAPRLGLALNPNEKKKDTYFFTQKEYSTTLSDMTDSAENCLILLNIISKLNGTTNGKVEREGYKM